MIVLSACSSDSATAPSQGHGIQFVSGNNVTDTADAVLAQPVVLIIHDSTGALAPLGTVVRFLSVQNIVAEAFVKGLTDSSFNTLAIGTTDQSGRTGAFIALGPLARPARVIISVPTLGITDTARFTVTPASAANIIVGPADTTLYTGKTYQLTGRVSDQYGNVRNDSITWGAPSGITVSRTGLVTTSTVGRYTITGTAGTKTVSDSVSVVPHGRIVAWQMASSNIVAFDMDGSNMQTLAVNVPDGGIGVHPAWIPNTNTVIYATYNGTYEVLQTVTMTGTIAPFFTTQPPNVSHEAEPQPSADGSWVYFGAFDTRCSADLYCLYRARSDGSAPQLLGNYVQPEFMPLSPTPSPDGGKVAFVSDNSGIPSISVLNVTTNTLSPWHIGGDHPSWSPDGTHIAYLPPFGTVPISVMDSDGTNARQVTPAGRLYPLGPIAWSPDGQWLIARGTTTLELINVQTGAALPLVYASAMTSPSWK
ncbi:MAG TPA: Ig-like domain-containing protein [Gemmatimonadaceae bacterium]|nr:Ig-like domain-containing protein [Gemmatimonadaceae bacterium]